MQQPRIKQGLEPLVPNQDVARSGSHINAHSQHPLLDLEALGCETDPRPFVPPVSKLDTKVSPSVAAKSAGQKHAKLAIPVAGSNHRNIVILRLKEVKARIGLCRSSIYGLMDRDGPYHDAEFPQSIKLSTQAVGWLESEIEAWLASRVAASRS